jgi:hypothetical protein
MIDDLIVRSLANLSRLLTWTFQQAPCLSSHRTSLPVSDCPLSVAKQTRPTTLPHPKASYSRQPTPPSSLRLSHTPLLVSIPVSSMADFMVNLWEAVFTPGPTPTLLLATNVTFGALQLVLAGLLAATYSIHFFILSVLCGGLWWAINWFAYELQQAQQKEAEAERIRKSRSTNQPGDMADDEATETEVETAPGVKVNVSQAELAFNPTQEDEQIRSKILNDFKSGTPSTTSAGTTGLQPSEGESRLRKAPSDLSASTNDFGTDSEWIKVDEE